MKEFDLVVVGAGTAGMSSAGHAVKSGARIAMVEEKAFGGECLHTGCVPTKTLLWSAKLLSLMKRADEFGLSAENVTADFRRIMERKARIIEQIARHDDPKNFERAGISVFHGHASFAEPNELQVGGETLRSRKFIIATGSLPTAPPIEGLKETGFITNIEAVNLDHLPASIIILGAGPVGKEFCQIFGRLGSDVTVLEMAEEILPKEDPELSEILGRELKKSANVFTGAKVTKAEKRNGLKVITAEINGQPREFGAEELMVAAGRKPNIEGLNLQAAGVEADKRGIKVDDELRTTAPHIWATGDVNGKYQFTHVAEYEGAIAANNATSDRPRKISYRVIPWVTFTDPELARVGMTEDEARKEHDDVKVGRFAFRDLDKAVIIGETEGIVKIISRGDTGQILGAHILGTSAGDIIGELVLAMREKIPVGEIARTVHAYPTLPEAIYWDSVNLAA